MNRKARRAVALMLLPALAAALVFGCSRTGPGPASAAPDAMGPDDTLIITPPMESTTPFETADKIEHIALTVSDNGWLGWDIPMEADGEKSFTASVGHPNLIGQEAIPEIVHTGRVLLFNGEPLKDGGYAELHEVNTLTLIGYDGGVSEYTLTLKDTSNGLPTVMINTKGAEIASRTDYTDAVISILGTGAEDIRCQSAGIRLRGNSTSRYPKKPYRIKFEKKQNVLGLGKAKSWVLLAGFLDPSAIRSQLAFGLAAKINADTAKSTGSEVFAPRVRPVEVYLNGEYQGLYDLGDQLQANEIRVAIDESGDEGSTEPDVGYLVEFEVAGRVWAESTEGSANWTASSFIRNAGSSGGNQGGRLYFQFKLPENPNDEQKAYITGYLQEVNDRILARDKSVEELIDLDSFIDWYIVNELFKNADSHMQSSIYLYKDKGGKLVMGPVWDFDLSAGALTNAQLDSPEGWRTRNDEYCGWFKALFSDKMFADRLGERWQALRGAGIIDSLFAEMDQLEEELAIPAVRDFEMWHDEYIRYTYGSWIGLPKVVWKKDWPSQTAYLRDFLIRRVAWMDTMLK